MDNLGFGRVTRVPSNTTSPCVSGVSPAMLRRRVVLPQPLGPSTVRNSRSCTDRLTLSRTVSSSDGEGEPSGRAKLMQAPRISSRAAGTRRLRLVVPVGLVLRAAYQPHLVQSRLERCSIEGVLRPGETGNRRVVADLEDDFQYGLVGREVHAPIDAPVVVVVQALPQLGRVLDRKALEHLAADL